MKEEEKKTKKKKKIEWDRENTEWELLNTEKQNTCKITYFLSCSDGSLQQKTY